MLNTFKSKYFASLLLMLTIVIARRTQGAIWPTWPVTAWAGATGMSPGMSGTIIAASVCFIIMPILVGFFGRLLVAALFVEAVFSLCSADLGPIDDYLGKLAYSGSGRLRDTWSTFTLYHNATVVTFAALTAGTVWGCSKYARRRYRRR